MKMDRGMWTPQCHYENFLLQCTLLLILLHLKPMQRIEIMLVHKVIVRRNGQLRVLYAHNWGSRGRTEDRSSFRQLVYKFFLSQFDQA